VLTFGHHLRNSIAEWRFWDAIGWDHAGIHSEFAYEACVETGCPVNANSQPIRKKRKVAGEVDGAQTTDRFCRAM